MSLLGKEDKEILKEIAREIINETCKHKKDNCIFTKEEIESIKSFVKVEKKALRTLFIAVGTILLWLMKDAIEWIVRHIHIMLK